MIKHCNPLIPNNYFSNWKYLNVFISYDESAEMAEGSLQSIDTGRPSGYVGSIPTLGALC